MKNTQANFSAASDEFKDYWKQTDRVVHGGAHAVGKRKTVRPFHSRKPIHLVLRASGAKGSTSMWAPGNKRPIEMLINKFASRYGIRIYEYSNNGNHLHLALRAHNKGLFKKFLRTITGLIARHVLKAKKGKAKGKFWDGIPFTRIADWGKSYKSLAAYVLQNILEAAGVIPYQPRNHMRRGKTDARKDNPSGETSKPKGNGPP